MPPIVATAIFNESDGLRFELQNRFNSRRYEFPNDSINYVDNFNEIEKYLNEHVHREVVTGAALNGNGLLNDHGVEHVFMVIQRAGLLLKDRVINLSGYEIYLLLLSIHFHDVGNISGRENHETKILEVMNALGNRLPLDKVSQRYIANIAKSHGGNINNNKDTICALITSDYLMGMSIRPSLIASILRFADEISDDHTRAARFLLSSGNLPEESKLYHYYSQCLQPIAIEGNTLIFKYNVTLEFAMNSLSKVDIHNESNNLSVYLYDEILDRLKKCLCELEYCRLYSCGFLQQDTITAKIEFYHPNQINAVHVEDIRMRLKGYPNTSSKSISDLVETPLIFKSGIELKEHLEYKK